MLCTIDKVSLAIPSVTPLCSEEPYKETLKEIQSFDMSKVMAKVKYWKPDIDHAEAEKQYRLFIYLCSIYDGFLVVPNAMVDEVWHNHILFTHDYQAFCHQVAGRFIHHNPLVADFSVFELAEDRRALMNLAKLHFGWYPFGPESNNSWCGSCRNQ